MEMFPEYDFLQTQPQLYEWVKEDYPELYSQIRDRVAEGRAGKRTAQCGLRQTVT